MSIHSIYSTFLCRAIFALILVVLPQTYLQAQITFTCPTLSGLQWQQGVTVYYSFETSVRDEREKTQIRLAFSKWSSANQLNCTHVTFREGTPLQPTDSRILLRNAILTGRAAAKTTPVDVVGNTLYAANITFDPSVYFLNTVTNVSYLYYDELKDGFNSVYLKTALHEIGHTMGLNHYTEIADGCHQTALKSVMNDGCEPNDLRNIVPTDLTACDTTSVSTTCPTPTPTPTPIQPSCLLAVPRNNGTCPVNTIPDPNNGIYCCPLFVAGGCNGAPIGSPPSCSSGFVLSGGVCQRSTAFANSCNRFGGYDFQSCGCLGDCAINGSCSPIVVDVSGNGFTLTDALNGVNFDVDANGTAERRAWTAAGSDDAWLVLDRNGNGTIDGGREMFGSVTSQPPPPAGVEMNGFNALAEYDEAGFGGNGDGQITNQDAVFNRLRLWQDANHNGISEASELHTLPELGLRKIDLDYRQSNRTDQYGNQFKYRSKVRDAQDAQLGRWAWDVFLVR